MREPRPIDGLRAPLFERLADTSRLSGEDMASLGVLDREALRASVRADLARLLNTRSVLRGVLLDLAEGTVLDYGLPDFCGFAPVSEADRVRLAEVMARKIGVHEPRLRNVRVVVRPSPESPTRLTGVISAVLAAGSIREPVFFPLAIDLQNPEEAQPVSVA